jgi:hypothetical protein
MAVKQIVGVFLADSDVGGDTSVEEVVWECPYYGCDGGFERIQVA